MDPKILFDGEDLLVSGLGFPDQGRLPDRLFVTFDNWEHQRDGFPAPKVTMGYVDKGFAHLHLSSARNDWFLSPELTEVLDVIKTVAAPFKWRGSMAFSMGGNGAMLVSRAVQFDQILFVSPNIAFASGLPYPDERFDSDFRDPAFAKAAQDTLIRRRVKGTQAVVFYDPGISLDRAHARLTANCFDGARMVQMKGGGHPASKRIQKANRFRLFIEAATAKDGIDPTPIAEAQKALMQQWQARRA